MNIGSIPYGADKVAQEIARHIRLDLLCPLAFPSAQVVYVPKEKTIKYFVEADQLSQLYFSDQISGEAYVSGIKNSVCDSLGLNNDMIDVDAVGVYCVPAHMHMLCVYTNG